jgi:ABC-type sugar transport system ATPase subunit
MAVRTVISHRLVVRRHPRVPAVTGSCPARYLARRTLLLLDEVAGGLTDPEVAQLVEIVRSVNAEGTTVIWIEHVVRALTPVVGRLMCLAGGVFVGDGDPATVLADPAVREVFLGTEVTAALAGGSLEPSRADGGPEPASPVDGDGAVGGDRSEP